MRGDLVNNWLKAGILLYLSLLFFGSFIAIGIVWTGALDESLPFIDDINISVLFLRWIHWGLTATFIYVLFSLHER